MPVSVIVFDLDGTLIDSNPVKRRGFDHVFENYRDGIATVAKVLETHRKSFRTVVIRLTLEQLYAAGEPDSEPTEERVAELAARYNRFCIDGAVTCPEIAGAEAMLKQLSSSYKLFINTATATPAAVEIIERRGWNNLFTGVFGFPPDKVGNLRAVADQTGVTNEQIIMVGDDDHDLDGAAAFECPFIAVQGPTSHFTRPPARAISHLNELSPLLESQ
jgi:phosphoglycolate phosphatase-like HAD superfamily hydrolase